MAKTVIFTPDGKRIEGMPQATDQSKKIDLDLGTQPPYHDTSINSHTATVPGTTRGKQHLRFD